MIKKVLVIIPHSDDEISLVGTIMNQFIENNIELVALFVTNGDFEADITEKRMKETLLATQKMQFSKVLFLGYSDNPGKGYKHIHDINNEYIYSSMEGRQETYGIDSTIDYRYNISGYHNKYLVKNIENDIRECLLEEKADLLIYPDWDVHPDHRMTSLLVDSAVVTLIKEYDYRPIILKKFAYAGVWFGQRDYYYYPMKETILEESEMFPNDYNQIVRVRVDETMYPLRFWKSPVYSFCKVYKTQNASERFERIVNADSLYFYRDTTNLSINSEISVSSGKPDYINDFYIIKPKSIIDRNSVIQDDYDEYSWIPDENDMSKEIKFSFAKGSSIKQISFYLPNALVNQKIRLVVKLDNGASKEFTIGEHIVNTCVFEDTQKDIKSISIQIIEFSGKRCGFSEIEIFSEESAFPWNSVPFTEYNNNPGHRNLMVGKSFMVFYKIVLYIKFDLYYRIKKAAKRLLKR